MHRDCTILVFMVRVNCGSGFCELRFGVSGGRSPNGCSVFLPLKPEPAFTLSRCGTYSIGAPATTTRIDRPPPAFAQLRNGLLDAADAQIDLVGECRCRRSHRRPPRRGDKTGSRRADDKVVAHHARKGSRRTSTRVPDRTKHSSGTLPADRQFWIVGQ